MKSDKPITLIATIGSSPAVLTEAVHSLHEKKLWPVTEIEIITTAHGAEKIREGLFGEGRNWIRLCDEIGIDPFQIKIPTIMELKGVQTPDEEELEDIRNSDEDRFMASTIQRVVRAHTKENEKRVFALLSGGRKTMSSHLMSAMQLFGRRDDRLFHILVSEPFEHIPGFWFPTRKSTPLEFNTRKGELIAMHDARDARIDLIDIPYIRLRSFLETQIDYSASFDELIASADEKLLTQDNYPVYDLHLHLNGSDSKVSINGIQHTFSLPDRQFALLAFFIWIKINHGSHRPIAWKDVIHDPDLLDAYHIFYRTIKQGNFLCLEDDYRDINISEFEKKDPWMNSTYWFKNEVLKKKSFSKELSNLKKNLNENLDVSLPDINAEHFIKIEGRSKLLEKTISTPIPLQNCRITGLNPKDAEILGLNE